MACNWAGLFAVVIVLRRLYLSPQQLECVGLLLKEWLYIIHMLIMYSCTRALVAYGRQYGFMHWVHRHGVVQHVHDAQSLRPLANML